jgi:uncharacterized surface protein with fasciclin (FAS1) repeats
MKLNNNYKPASILSMLLLLVAMVSCNKDVPAPVPVTFPPNGTTPTLATLLDAPDMTILKAAVTKAGLISSLSNTSLRFTVFAPDDAAMTASGITLAAVNALPVTTIVPLIQYHVVPQTVLAANIPTTFPNLQYPSLLNPAPSVSALLRLTTFPSKRAGGAWVNNIPIKSTDVAAVNGVMHKVALVVAPPSRYLWDRINTDTDLTYLKAAIQRADSGIVPASTLQAGLQNIGANLTVFAPNDAAFQGLLTAQITGYLVSIGVNPTVAAAQAAALASSPAIFSNPLVANVLTPTVVRGIVVYHVLGSRAFSNNFPTTATSYPTLLNGAVATHPGLSLTATFTGPSVTAATVKGVANATAATIAINPTPEPGGSSDQHYLNGTIHKINQVLLPQ